VLRRLVRIVSTRIGSLEEALLNKLGPTTVVGGVVGDLDEDDPKSQPDGPCNLIQALPFSSVMEVPLSTRIGGRPRIDICACISSAVL
jgi:hypothetical protein